MRLRYLHVFFVLCFALTGCAVRGPAKSAACDPESTPSSLRFSEKVAALPEGSTQYFTESPFGPVTIAVGTSYLSGLGNECRSARATEGAMSHRFALCSEGNGSWRFIPTIFESMPR